MKNNDQHDGGGSFCMCDLCQEFRKRHFGNSSDIPAIYQTITCKYCGREHNGAYYPPLCDGCGASLETGNIEEIAKAAQKKANDKNRNFDVLCKAIRRMGIKEVENDLTS